MGMIGCCVYGGVLGNVTRLLAPLDGDLNFCGEYSETIGDVSRYKYLYLPDLGNAEGNVEEMF